MKSYCSIATANAVHFCKSIGSMVRTTRPRHEISVRGPVVETSASMNSMAVSGCRGNEPCSRSPDEEMFSVLPCRHSALPTARYRTAKWSGNLGARILFAKAAEIYFRQTVIEACRAQ
jgi:uncharacterized protein (DUF2237 family)